MSTEKRVEKLRRRLRSNFQRVQQNVILAHEQELEANRQARGEHSDVSNDDLNFPFFDSPLVKVLIRIGRHQPHCRLF
jgi:hypothetical protein